MTNDSRLLLLPDERVLRGLALTCQTKETCG